MRQKSDIRIILDSKELSELKSDLKHLIKIILLELRTEVRAYKDIMFLYALARAIVQVESIFQLWELKHISDCLILYRTQVERLLNLYYLIDTNSIKEFEDWSFIQNFDMRNKAKSDQEQNQYLDKTFWNESPQRIKRYEKLKSRKIKWKRPNSSTLEETAKKHNIYFLYKYGYKYASGFVHPLSSDGEEEFELVTGIKAKGKPELDTTPILFNSIIVLLAVIRLFVNESSFECHVSVSQTLRGVENYLHEKNADYKNYLKNIEDLILDDNKIFKKYAT